MAHTQAHPHTNVPLPKANPKPTFGAFWGDYFLNYRHFLVAYLQRGFAYALPLLAYLAGVALMIEWVNPQLLYALGLNAADGQMVLLVWFGGGVAAAGLSLGLGGLSVQLRAWLSGGKTHFRRAILIFLYANWTLFLAWWLFGLLKVLGGGADFLTAPLRLSYTAVGLCLVAIAFVFSTFRSYFAAVQLFGIKRGAARIFFLILPVLTYLGLLGLEVRNFLYQDYTAHMEYRLSGIEAQFEGDYPRAKRSFHLALSHLTDSEVEGGDAALVYEFLGDLERLEQNTSDAAFYYRKGAVFAASPKQNALLSGKTALMTGTIDVAVKEFETVLNLDPNAADAHRALASIYAGDFGKEFQDWQRALPHNEAAYAAEPNYPAALEGLAINYSMLQQQDKLLTLANNAIKTDSLNPTAHFYAGLMYYEQSNYPLAAKHLNKALQLNPALRTPDLEQVLQEVSAKPEPPKGKKK